MRDYVYTYQVLSGDDYEDPQGDDIPHTPQALNARQPVLLSASIGGRPARPSPVPVPHDVPPGFLTASRAARCTECRELECGSTFSLTPGFGRDYAPPSSAASQGGATQQEVGRWLLG